MYNVHLICWNKRKKKEIIYKRIKRINFKFNIYRLYVPQCIIPCPHTYMYTYIIILPLKTEILRYRLRCGAHKIDVANSRYFLLIILKKKYSRKYYFNNLNRRIFQLNFFVSYQFDTFIKLNYILLGEWWKCGPLSLTRRNAIVNRNDCVAG